MIADSVVDEKHARDVGQEEDQYERGDDVYGHVFLLPRSAGADSARSAWVG